MKQKELLDSVKKYLARFQAQISISNENNEYDINIHSENVLIPILDEVFNVNLKNANYSEDKNVEAIDLVDENKKIAFQITSTSDIGKIKSTISKFLSSRFKNKVDRLFVFLLSDKQSRYSQEILNKISLGKIQFNSKENVLDFGDLYRIINATNNIDVISRVNGILEKQFSDIKLNNSFTINQYDTFRENYKNSCIANFSRINFFGLAVNSIRPREIELYSLFVNPNFVQDNPLMYSGSQSIQTKIKSYLSTNISPVEIELSKTLFSDIVTLDNRMDLQLFENYHSQLNFSNEISFSELFSDNKHKVIIGKPGAGKSSFIKFSICKILEGDMTIFNNTKIYDVLPLRIELHKYNTYKKKTQGGFISYLSTLIKDEYQLFLDEVNIETIVKFFPTLIFFDGLDEIFDIQERINVRNEIESFLNLYSKVKSIVTSRYESYEEVSLSHKLFVKYEILDFNDLQIEEYVRKWYAIEESSVNTREKEISNCLVQLSTVDKELKCNPLLLSLILLLYRNELDIPTSKLSIYEGCTNTIVETRDTKEKKLEFRLKVSNIISVFAALAYWQFDSEKKGETVSYEKVKVFIKNYLIERGEFTDDYTAENATSEFINFAKTRSIYFENKFTHKTFLEYFSSYYIFSYYYGNWKKAAELNEIISTYIGLSAWSVVLELLICKIDSTQINYEVIDELVDKQIEENCLDSLIFFLQIVRYLKNISPKKINYIISKSIEYCFIDGQDTREGKLDYKEILFNSLSSLMDIDKFRNSIEISFLNFIKNAQVPVESICIFAYEFAVVSGNTSLLKIIQDQKIDCNTEYLFILKYYPNLFNPEKYLNILHIFISTFGANSTKNIYSSSFNQKIFYGSNKFNWNLNYIANVSTSDVYDSYKKLIDLGVSKETLLECAKNKTVDLNIFEPRFKKNKTPDKNYIAFHKALVSTYSAVHSLIYEKFYNQIQKKKKKRGK